MQVSVLGPLILKWIKHKFCLLRGYGLRENKHIQNKNMEDSSCGSRSNHTVLGLRNGRDCFLRHESISQGKWGWAIRYGRIKIPDHIEREFSGLRTCFLLLGKESPLICSLGHRTLSHGSPLWAWDLGTAQLSPCLVSQDFCLGFCSIIWDSTGEDSAWVGGIQSLVLKDWILPFLTSLQPRGDTSVPSHLGHPTSALQHGNLSL